MKTFIFSLVIFFLFGLETNAQNLLGVRWDGNSETFNSLGIASKNFTDIDTLKGVETITQGESTFDPINKRYFNNTNLGITVIDAQTGIVTDTIANSIRMMGIEYDPNTNKLLGCYWTGGVFIFNSLDIVTKTYTNIGTLNGIESVMLGESTFDPVNKRYFLIANTGIVVIDAQTGTITNTISNTNRTAGIEYDPKADQLHGIYWNDSLWIFNSLDISTQIFTDKDTLNGIQSVVQGESTFDGINQRYFNKTDIGISVIDARTGTIIDTIANKIDMSGLEYFNASFSGLSEKRNDENGFAVFPNPFSTSATVQFNTKIKNAQLNIYNINGQKIKSNVLSAGNKITINRENLSAGIYLISLIQDNKIIEFKKLIITD